jgi:hypothetical protein
MQTYSAHLAETLATDRHHIHVWRHGSESNVVIVIDDYLDDPDALIDAAANGPAFAPNGPYYPGIRAPFPQSALQALL